MKKMTLVSLAVLVLVSGILLGGPNTPSHEVDGMFRYTDYDFRHFDEDFRFKKGYENVYYYEHPESNVYFVLAEGKMRVLPDARFQKYLDVIRFYRVTQTDLIAYGVNNGYDYYDSYVRFHHYYDHYCKNKWDVAKHYQATRAYRQFYQSRTSNKKYYKKRKRALKEQRLAKKRVEKLLKRQALYKKRRGEIDDKDFWEPGRDGHDTFRGKINAGGHSGNNRGR